MGGKIILSAIQLPLNLNLRDDAIFDNFFIGSNTYLIATLKNFILNPSGQFIFCYGAEGVGKTHLLQACCHEKKEFFYLSLLNYSELSPAIFESLEFQSGICIDDVDAIVGNHQWEEALFHFYNRARDNHASLLVSAKSLPHQLNYALPDLQSRLIWGLSIEIHCLTDEEKIQALQMRAKIRGFDLSSEVGRYLISHYSRTMHDLFFILEQLDQSSLIAKRRITIPFIKTLNLCYSQI